MSIRSNMKPATLLVEKTIRSKSGANKKTFVDDGIIEIGIYQKDDRVNTSSVRYNASNNIGLTYSNEVTNKHKIVQDGKIYMITGIIEGKINQLYLKVLENE